MLGWLAIGLLAALGSAQAGEGVLKIIAWPGYMERGQNDARYDWVTPFEQETGCKVSVRTALNSSVLGVFPKSKTLALTEMKCPAVKSFT